MHSSQRSCVGCAVQNRNKLLKHLIGHLSTAVTHRILQEAIAEEILRKYYGKEAMHAMEKAIEYRKSINPPDTPISEDIRERIMRNVRNELQKRQAKGYPGLDFERIPVVTDAMLAECETPE